MEFEGFPKIARLFRNCVISEKIDGTNAQIIIQENGDVLAGSRSRIIHPWDDNFGFARWVFDHKDELVALGEGRHFGEWWGAGIQRRYGLSGADKRFSLFNVARWEDPAVRPACCSVVPVLHRGIFSTEAVRYALDHLRREGSMAAPGFMKPEGVIVWHEAGHVGFKATIEKDEEWKGKQ